MATLFPVVEVMLMSSIRRTQVATWVSMTTVHVGSNRAVNELSASKVISAHGEFGPVNSNNIL